MSTRRDTLSVLNPETGVERIKDELTHGGLMGLTREAKLKSKFGHVYPEIRPGWWEPASVIARRVADRLLTRHGYAGLLKRRVLLDDHFEFRGGPPQDIRPGGRVSRFCDGVR